MQERTRQLFAEMDYTAEISKQVPLAGRGEKEIDVFVVDPNASYNRIYLIECKHWESRIPQEVVHAFKTIMEETGANTGFIISKIGFQSGAYEAARYTNIKLLSFDELQHLYGDEWFRKQRAKLEAQVLRLREISRLHFDQWNQLGYPNNMCFRTGEQVARLEFFHLWVHNLILDSQGRWPESYKGPEPVRISNDPTQPEREIQGWFEISTVREYFRLMTTTAKACADAFDSFRADAMSKFESLANPEQDSIFDHMLSAMHEESPIRVLKNYMAPEEYRRLLELIKTKHGPSNMQTGENG